jgi:hypothetical protein
VFLCENPAEVDSVYSELTAAGYDGHLPPFDAPWLQRHALRAPRGMPATAT